MTVADERPVQESKCPGSFSTLLAPVLQFLASLGYCCIGTGNGGISLHRALEKIVWIAEDERHHHQRTRGGDAA